MKAQNALHLMRYERTFLALKEDTPGLQAFHIMPNALGNIHPIESFLWTEHYTL
jgi:hypothetical protein